MNKNNNNVAKCRKCGAELNGDFCSQCGTPRVLQRVDKNYIASEIISVINVEKGIFFTIKELLIRPGKAIHEFIHYDRNRLVKPILFIIVCSLVYTIAQHFLRFEDGYANTRGAENSFVSTIFAWVQQNYGYANLLMSIFIAGWLKLFFKKHGYSFFEIIILLCF